MSIKKNKLSAYAVAALCVAVIAAVSWHSVEEIHYLKGFYPSSFTVQEACYASIVELVKVSIISIPLVALMIAALLLARKP